MTIALGLDIGGTKIAGAAFDDAGRDLAKAVTPTPQDYNEFLVAVCDIIEKLNQPQDATIGIGLPYGVANMPGIAGKPVRADLMKILRRPIEIANDANCAALAEAMEGAGVGFDSVFGLILGTGVGGGFVMNGKAYAGAHGLMGEIGHLPLPYYEPSDGEPVLCGCGQAPCIEKLASGPGLQRLHEKMSGETMDAAQIADMARQGDEAALQTLDRFYTVLAKAMVTIIHSFDPEIITVSGGLNSLPGLYDEVPKRWGRYTLVKNPANRLVPAKHGATAGLRGAAWLGRNA